MIATATPIQPAPKESWAEAKLEALTEDGFIHEVVDGEPSLLPGFTYPIADLFLGEDRE